MDCQLDRIQKCLKPSAVRTILGSLPKTLGETYTNIIARIDEEYLSDALTIFQWLIYSRRVLRLDEIAEVLAIEYAGEPEFSPEFRLQDARDILSVCSSTITIGKSNVDLSVAEVRLAHASVREFLLAGGADFGMASKSVFDARMVHEKLAHACLAYLLYLGSPNLEGTSIPNKFPLVDYAAQNWMIHAKEADESSRICEMTLKLLRQDELCFKRLLQFHDIDRPWRTIETKYSLPNSGWRETRVPATRQMSPLYYASLVGLTSVVRSLLQGEENVNESCGFFGDALSAAAAQGHEDVVKILLQNGANADTHSGFQRGALMAAAAAGHESILELLLAAGANISKGHFRHGNALLAAIRNGHEEVVRLLIKHGANVDKRVGKGPSPIVAAASYGQVTIVKMLLEAGARCDDEALESAARRSHEPVIEILRTHLAGPQQFNDILSSREMVTSSGSEDHLTATSSKGAPQPSSISLQSAAAGGLENAVQQLLDSGISVNSWEKYEKGTALCLAAANGHVSLVKLLLQRGADINLQPDYYTHSPLDAAAKSGHLPVVRALLHAQPPASIAVKADSYGNPLESAAFSGNLAVFQEILSFNPDVNAMCTLSSGGTPLAAAAAVGHDTIVQLLLSRGADVNLVPLDRSCSRKLTPLASAAFGGHIEVARRLLDGGADTKLVSGWNQYTPLAVAVSKRQTSMVEFLLNADGNQTFDSSALKAAVSGTPEDISLLRLLLNRYVELSNSDVDTQPPSSTSESSLTENCTPALLLATRLNRPSAFRELLQYGADVNGQDRRGYTSLHEAAQYDEETMAKILVQEYHADLHAKLLNGSLPIHIGAQYGSDKCITFFLSQNVDVDALNDELRTPLHTAVDHGNQDTVRLLIAAGARLDIADQHDMTALDLAEYQVAEEQKKAEVIVEIIVEEMKKQNLEIPMLASSHDSGQSGEDES